MTAKEPTMTATEQTRHSDALHAEAERRIQREERDADERAAECAACQGDETADLRCAKSKRPCGHHCNHVMTQDHCDWCDTTWGEDGVETRPDVEAIAAKVHEAWMDAKRAQGIESRPSEWGEEQMVPYADLSERAKDLDRGTVVAVLAAIDALTAPPLRCSRRCSEMHQYDEQCALTPAGDPADTPGYSPDDVTQDDGTPTFTVLVVTATSAFGTVVRYEPHNEHDGDVIKRAERLYRNWSESGHWTRVTVEPRQAALIPF